MSEHWARHFRTRHPDLQSHWASGLECCRAKALNHTQVTKYFDILIELIKTYNIIPSNIYNMDENGVQLGNGKHTLVLVDRDQKTIQHLENGDYELVTIIKTVCADGSSLPPSVVVHTEAAKKFRGIRQVIRDHEKAEEDLQWREEHHQCAAAKEAAKAIKNAVTLAAKRIADAQKAVKRELVLARKAKEAAAKKAAVDAKCSAADAEEKKCVAHDCKIAIQAEKEHKRLERASKTICQQIMQSENEDSPHHSSENLNLIDDNTLEPPQPSNMRPCPRP